jgi:hypothetical protein
MSDPYGTLSDREKDAVFRVLYRVMSPEGKCDAVGGMEYKRVQREWIAAGRRSGLEQFIHTRANMPSRPPESSTS